MMTYNGKYSLDLISRDQDSKGKQFKEYKIDGIYNIGVYENEPFLIRFKNHTGKRVQVRISVDGTDVLTGKLAHTNPTNDGMWVVGPWNSMDLKAWPEDNQGGAEFLFTHQEDSVVANTHGDMSSKGIIAIAVFEEEPSASLICRNNIEEYVWSDKKYYSNNFSESKGILRGVNCNDSNNLFLDSIAVGAGGYVNQNITKTSGLVKPEFNCSLKIKYQSWTSLRSKIRQQVIKKIESTDGFPGDREKLINLGNTPRLENVRRRMFNNEYVEDKNRASRNKRRLCPEEKYVEYQRFL